ncbi:SDR family oxidoreductase [Halobaculum litoreum]|uniref:SDR family oxidoreductase n=1 Tax=Halobaculum litoreum TaxID=3031998 RepID=A0ABD5XY21_9EURY|nr:SDR family oxidoreductase [Halobaculum sp. DT92]
MTDGTTVLLTGFPGFLGSALVERLLDRHGSADRLLLLVQSHYREAAERRRADLLDGAATADGDGDLPTVDLVEGDITDPDLGLPDHEAVARETSLVYHLAAVYDLGVDRDLAEAVNVDGTRHVLDLCRAAAAAGGFDRLHYVSTCYVSGRYDGVFTGEMLAEAGPFNNHYEATKHRAEVLVREAMAGDEGDDGDGGDDGLPATVYRPAIAVGDSATGETQKYDGPYYLLSLVRRQHRVAVVPRLGDPRATTLNLVPRDYVVDAVEALSGMSGTVGGTYQLCDPNPPTIAELYRAFGRATGRRILPVPTHPRLAKAACSAPLLGDLLDLEPETIPYLTHPTEYADGATRRALAGTGVAPPAFGSYVDRLVAYVRDHPEVTPDAMT